MVLDDLDMYLKGSVGAFVVFTLAEGVKLVRAWGMARQVDAEATATEVLAHAQARGSHAEAELKETDARMVLEGATRAWADRLIQRYDQENADLRILVLSARSECEVQRQAQQQQFLDDRAIQEQRHMEERELWEREMGELRRELEGLHAQYVELRDTNSVLRVMLDRLDGEGSGLVNVSGDDVGAAGAAGGAR